MTTIEKLTKRINETQTFLCVGLDSDLAQIPAKFRDKKNPQFLFNQWIIDQTHDLVCAYKPNLAFYEARGEAGWRELRKTMEYLRKHYPDILTIADAKRADIGSTNEGYVTAIFDELQFDAITLHPYLGQEALQPFLQRKDKACIILCKTSNPGAGELQDLLIQKKPLWFHLAQRVAKEWNTNNNCMLVAGATYPDELKIIRQIVGEMPLLVPGVGAQGGDLESVLSVGLTKQRRGLIINASRSVIYADNPKEEAEKLVTIMKQYFKEGEK